MYVCMLVLMYERVYVCSHLPTSTSIRGTKITTASTSIPGTKITTASTAIVTATTTTTTLCAYVSMYSVTCRSST